MASELFFGMDANVFQDEDGNAKADIRCKKLHSIASGCYNCASNLHELLIGCL